MKNLSEEKYKLFMESVNDQIKNTEWRLKRLEKLKEVSKMSYGEWVNWQNGGGRIKNIDKYEDWED